MPLTKNLKNNIKSSLIFNTNSPRNIICVILRSSSKSYLFLLMMLQIWRRMILVKNRKTMLKGEIFPGRNFWELLESRSLSNFAGIHFHEWMQVRRVVWICFRRLYISHIAFRTYYVTMIPLTWPTPTTCYLLIPSFSTKSIVF